MCGKHVIKSCECISECLILCCQLILRIISSTAVAISIEATEFIECKVHNASFSSFSAEGDNKGLVLIVLVREEIVQRLYSRIAVSVRSL